MTLLMRQLSSQTVALPMLDETAVIQQAQHNPATFGTIYDHYFDNVYNFVRYRVQDAALADELTAQIFEKALTRIDSYKPHKSPFPACYLPLPATRSKIIGVSSSVAAGCR